MKYVLFVCNHNAGRSQMAEAFFARHAPHDVRAESAGSTPSKSRGPWSRAMAEVGIASAAGRPRKSRGDAAAADWAVTMGCGDACPYVPTTVESWAPDPSARAATSAPDSHTD